MNNQREIIIKKRIESISKRKLNQVDFLNEVNKKFQKKDIEYLFNNKEYCSFLVISYLNTHFEDEHGIWIGRASVFIESLINTIFELKKYYNFEVTPNLILYYFSFDNLHKLSEYMKNTGFKNTPLESYIFHLPGYHPSKKHNIPPTVYEQHGYIAMQFTSLFNNLESYFNFENTPIRIETLSVINKLKNF